MKRRSFIQTVAAGLAGIVPGLARVKPDDKTITIDDDEEDLEYDDTPTTGYQSCSWYSASSDDTVYTHGSWGFTGSAGPVPPWLKPPETWFVGKPTWRR